MARNDEQKKVMENLMPVMATAALQGAGAGNEALQAIVAELAQDYLEKRRKEKTRQERLAINAVQAAKDEAAARAARVQNCPHTKQDDSTRLAGQVLTGTGQLCLVCGFCGKDFFLPPDEKLGQEAPPRHLIPRRDEIGG